MGGKQNLASVTPEECKASIASLSIEIYSAVLSYLLHICALATCHSQKNSKSDDSVGEEFEAGAVIQLVDVPGQEPLFNADIPG